VVVDRSGKISLPYAGEIPVVDMTPRQVQEKIILGLSDRAIQPQAIVNIVKNESNTVILNGDVSKPGRYPLSLKGDRLLDLVADAGGAKTPATETYVTFMRGNRRGSQLLQAVVENEDENVFIQAGDQIYLSHEPRRYSVFGAIAKPGVYPFGSMTVNLLEGVAAAGGLIDERADGTGLFVFRHEPRHVVDSVAPGHGGPDGSMIPVVYRVNMREPAAYFYAKSMMLQDKDVLYVANARTVEVGKVLSLIQLGTRTVGNVLPYGRLVD
jgi:polysaccharide export outer membrane protein